MNDCNYGSQNSTRYTSSQALKDRVRQKTEAIFADRPRDLPLLVGFTEGAKLLAGMGFTRTRNPRVDDAIGAVCCSAVIAARMGRSVSFSLHGAFYSGKQRRYHDTLRLSVIRQAVQTAWVLGLVEVDWAPSWQGGGQGRQSQLWATPLLLDRAGDMTINRPRLRELIRLYDLEGRLRCYEETKLTRAMRADLHEWNDDLRARRIETTDPRVVRLEHGRALIPTKDDDGEFVVFLDQVEAYRRFKGDFDSMGRFCGPGYQSLTRSVRQTLQIDDQATRSADFGNSHFRMAHAKVGADPGAEDAYVISGYEGRRDTVKKAVNIALNCKRGRAQAVDTVAWEIAKEDRRLDLGTEEGAVIGPFEMRSADRLLTAIETRHKAIESVFYTGSGLGFMKVEADIIAATARQARRSFNIPVLGIHDEVIAPARHLHTVQAIMTEEWNRRVSVQPLVR